MNLDLKGKVALVTGGSRGIGKAVARQLAEEGVDVAVAARNSEINEATAKEIASATGRRVLPFQVDTGDDAAVSALVENVMAAFGRIDILVNSAAQAAGHGKAPKLLEVTNEHFWADMNIKVMGYLRMARAVTPHMRLSDSGRIINISGLNARLTGSIIGSMRNVSVAALTKNLADELAEFGITVTCVHPGLTQTEKTPALIAAKAREFGVSESEAEKRLTSQILAGRMMTSEEIAYIVAFLASPKSIAINGDVIAAGGGYRGAIYY